MSERQSFIDAIRANPDDDVARLVFADWLDEQPDDWSRATAEYIRISCSRMEGVPNFRGDGGEKEWVEANWERLLPSLATAGFEKYMHSGLKLSFKKDVAVHVRTDRGVSINHVVYHADVTFTRGFAEFAAMAGARDLVSMRLVAKDQPFARLASTSAFISRGPGLRTVVTVYRQSFESAMPGCPRNDVFDRIAGYDDKNGHHVLFLPEGDDEVGNFHAIRRARRAISDAVRSWAESPSVATPATG